jgi:uncharacterized membrane-anchored protein YitT (DUF2179 family)
MKNNKWNVALSSGRQISWNLLLIVIGSVLCAVAVNGILVPMEFFGAGFMGIALVTHYLIPAIPIAGLYFILNIPVFALGWMHVGRRFFLYSIPGTLIFSCALAWVQLSIPLHDRILSSLFAGVIMGVGSGIILKSLGSAGGLDILSIIFLKRFSIRLGTTILVFNGIILVAGALLFTLERALYTLIYIYVGSQVINLVVTGLNQRKAVIIISPQWEKISHEIMEKIQRGVTSLQGWGGYTGNEQRVLYTVITFRELSRLKPLIRKIDPEALVVVNETLEVMGRRIGNQPHW